MVLKKGMQQTCYYEILEISRDSHDAEIKKSYRRLAMKYHPDRNPDNPEAEQKFKDAAEAYDVLRDPEKKAIYDRYGHAGIKNNASGGFGNPEDIFSHFSDIFGDLFGFASAGMGTSRPTQGSDLLYNLTIDFRQAAHGDEVRLKLPKKILCTDCSGTGAAKGTSPVICKQCNGTGQIKRTQGFFQVATPCRVCNGKGKIIAKPCPKCKGKGILEDIRELSVRIPAGVDNGIRLRIRGEGELGTNDGPPGDLYVVIHVEDDKIFQRQGQDIIYILEISFVQAALGHKVDIPTLDNNVLLEIPKGVQSDTVLRIKDKGIPFLGQKKYGDLLVEVIVLTPMDLNTRQEELLREFESLEDKSTLDRVKDMAKKFGKAMGID